MPKYILFFNQIRKKDVPLVGGKTASLGEMFSLRLPVPNGFAITADAYRYFIKVNDLDRRIKNILKKTSVRNIDELRSAGSQIRNLIKASIFPKAMSNEITRSFQKLKSKYVAVRSSATAEDLPGASFAGQQETFLDTTEEQLMDRVRDCFASLFTDRAISYRVDKGFDHFKVALSVAVQRQISSKASGVMFTIDPDSGHENFIVINSGFGLGDYIVQGKITPDELWIFKKTCKVVDKKLGNKRIMEIRSARGVKAKRVGRAMQHQFSISDDEAERLAKYALIIEKHYGCAMDIEFAKDDKLYILQARPETVHSSKNRNIYREYRLKQHGKVLAKGLAIGRKISSGAVSVIKHARDIYKFSSGILVTKQTNPDWEPIMKIAKGIVTEDGGRTSHAAIVSRELGVPAILGVSNATRLLKNGQRVTLDCTAESGKILSGELKFSVSEHNIAKMPKTKTHVFVNIGLPDEAVDASLLPVDGVGLVREEFVTASFGVHPLEMIRQRREKEFIEKLSFGIAKIAAAFYPRPVIVRLSDFKTNEYRSLKGGEKYEEKEDNPMIGFRGASRYVSQTFGPAFRLELKAMKRCIGEFGLKNIKIMIPFCRTVSEAEKVMKLIKNERLSVEKYMMAEIPSNIILADKFSKLFNGFSIGSNDLTQLVLGIDRDNETLAKSFDERNAAVERMIVQLVKTAHKYRRNVGICGQAPSDHPDFVAFLVKNGIDSISVNPDVAVQTKLLVAKAEKRG
ncbi:MAG: phosphoenolpyruvate synthase [Candidatus Aenigmatarchaeota archaeon]